MTKPTTRKPHHMAFALDVPCACGSEWGRPGFAMVPGAKEYDVIPLCARCRARIATDTPTPTDDA